MITNFIQSNIWFIGPLVIWELVWKAFALWRAAKNDDKYWFIAMVIVNSVGILPILYLILMKKNSHKKN